MAKALDDDVFGEFTFASNPEPQLSEENDDEWSDFVKSPQQQSSAAWIKPTGALPLSIFGEEDGEEDHGARFLKSDNGDVYANSGVDLNRSKNVNLTGGEDHSQFENKKSGNGEFDFSRNGIFGKTSPVMSSKDLEMDGAKRQVEIDIDNGGWDFKGGNLHVMNQNAEKLSKNIVVEVNKPQNGDDYDDHDGNDDDDDDGWEFKAANTGFPGKEVNGDDVNMMPHQDFAWNDPSSGHKTVPKTNGSVDTDTPFDFFANTGDTSSSTSKQVDFVAAQPSTAVTIGTNGSVDTDTTFDFFAKTGDTSSSTSKQVDFVATHPSTAVINGFVSDANNDIALSNIEHMWDHNDDMSADDDFGDFTSASAADDLTPEITQVVNESSPSKGASSTPAGQMLGMDKKSNHNGPLQLSIFGVDEPENDSLPDMQVDFGKTCDSDPRNSHKSTKAVSINDLISSLYSQTGQNLTKTQSSLPSGISDSNLANDSNDLDDDSWEYKDAVQTRFDTTTPSESMTDEHPSTSSKLKLNNYLDFYLNLQRLLTTITKFQIESLKDSNVVASNEGVGFTTIDYELQLICKELEQMNLKFQEINPPVYSSGDGIASDLAEVLKEPHFQILETEYHLSQKLFVVDKDLKSAMELLRHANTMTRILTIATMEEQMTYITTWHKLISVCAEELKHGSLIWNQAVKNRIQSLVLSEPQGSTFVLALGEIYRVIVVLEASMKLFKLWIISGSTKLPDISSVLNECHVLWSTSGLEEALSTLSTSTPLDSALLLKSIKQIKNLDALALQGLVFAENSSFCQLSCLSAAVVPDMKMITWGKDQYFVTLANLWANLITPNPPNLPKLNLG